MRVIAVDPGETIGAAYVTWSTEGFDFYVTQNSDPQKILLKISEWKSLHGVDHCIVEDYLSAGYMTKQAKTTVKLVGAFEIGHGFETVAPQKRLSAVTNATQLIGDDAKGMYRYGRDAIAALAHAIAYIREYDS